MFEEVSFFQSVEDLHVSLRSGSYLLLIAEKTPLPFDFFDENRRCVGAVFPYVLYGENAYEEGIIAAKLSSHTTIHLACMQHLEKSIIPPQSHAILTLIENNSKHTDSFLERLYSLLPEKAKLIGGAGKNLFAHDTNLCKTAYCTADKAIILCSSLSIGLGVKHGCKTLISPFIATRCQGNVVEKINFQDAYSVYKHAIEQKTSLRFKEMDFAKIVQQHPLGILRYHKDFIVRQPIETDGHSITLAGSLDENSVLNILEVNKDELIEAAQEAGQLALNHFQGDAPSSVMLISCYSRFLFLEEAFKMEMKAIASLYPAPIPLWGMLSLGELANDNQEGIAFYNNTCVVGVLP